jgi:hypothetical protein
MNKKNCFKSNQIIIIALIIEQQLEVLNKRVKEILKKFQYAI